LTRGESSVGDLVGAILSSRAAKNEVPDRREQQFRLVVIYQL
jgi:hypothetical protein